MRKVPEVFVKKIEVRRPMSTPHIVSSHAAGVETITIQRNEKKNAITLEMYEGLVSALRKASADEDVVAVVIQGSGGMFTAGNDLGDFANAPPTGQDSPVYLFLDTLFRFPKPLIARVEGYAVGIGTTLLIHCDLVYASPDAIFQLPFVNLALVPEAGSSYLLPRAMGLQRASELLLLGERFDAAKAQSIGLVNEVLEGDAMEQRLNAVLDRFRALPPESVRLSKGLIRRGYDATLRETMEVEAELFVERLQSPEVAEAIAAFFERRPPNFRSVASDS